jgi:ABC-2 type transport system permease protein
MTTVTTGRVYDRGYRPYDGPRGGRSAAIWALWRASVRRALGFRRSWRQKLLPWVLLAIATVPAAVFVGVAYLTRGIDLGGDDVVRIISYREYVGVSTALMLFVAITAPDVMCPDRRQRVLPLILSRPLTGLDYAFAKLASIFAIVFAFAFVPQVVLFVGQMLVSEDGALRYARDNAEVLWQSPLAVLLLALYYSTIGVAVSSLTARRVVAAAMFLGLLLVTSVIAGAVQSARSWDHSLFGLVNLAVLPLYLRDLIFLGHVDPTSPVGGVEDGGLAAVLVYTAVVGTGAALLAYRYRWIER